MPWPSRSEALHYCIIFSLISHSKNGSQMYYMIKQTTLQYGKLLKVNATSYKQRLCGCHISQLVNTMCHSKQVNKYTFPMQSRRDNRLEHWALYPGYVERTHVESPQEPEQVRFRWGSTKVSLANTWLWREGNLYNWLVFFYPCLQGNGEGSFSVWVIPAPACLPR